MDGRILVAGSTQVAGFDVREGRFLLWVKGKEKAVINDPVSTRNFFPELAVLAKMFSEEG